MNQKFSTYLREIGLLNETTSSSIMNTDEKTSNKSFNDSSFDLLMKFFNNLDEEQKKFMSLHIPSNFIIISTKMKHDKLRSIIVQFNLRKKLILLKYFLIWKLNSNIAINQKNEKGINNNINKLNLVNIDNNEDPDIRESNQVKEEQKSKDNQSINRNSSNNDYYFKHLSNGKNIRNTYNSNNSESSNYKYINVYQNKNDSDKKSFILSENIIKPNNKYKINNSASHRKINKYKDKERNINVTIHLMTSLEEKEMLELEECYFRPKINKLRKGKGLYPSKDGQKKKKKRQEIFEKLYKYNEKYKLAKELRAIELEKIAGQKLTFIPSTIPKKNKKKSKMKSHSQLNISNQKQNFQKSRVKSEENLSFQERQYNYMIKKRKHSAEIKNQLDSVFNEICSFNPKINADKSINNNSTNKKSNKKNKKKNNEVFSRLYEDGRERINSRTKNEKKVIDKIMEMSNILNPEKNFDFNTINRLYENKGQKNNIKKIIKKVEEEEGTTFKPFISKDNYSKSVNGTFYERNQKLIKDRESFCEEENQKIVENEKRHIIGKDYTKEERQKVINNIINRLYNDSSFFRKSIKDNNNIKK